MILQIIFFSEFQCQMGAFATFLLILFFGFLVYLVVWMVLAMMEGTCGLDMIPNKVKVFWIYLFKMTRDGMAYLRNVRRPNEECYEML